MTIKIFLREPLLHFLILGLLLFALFAWVNRGAMYAPDEIVIDDSLLQSMQKQFESTWQRQPSQEELRGLIDNWTRDEILFREGLALGLDRDDVVIRRRVVQKMDFITDSMTAVQPDEAALQAWLDANPEKYRIQPVYTFKQIYFDPGRHDADLQQIMAAALDELELGDRIVKGDSSLLPASLDDASESLIARTYGSEFAKGLSSLSVDEWVGPVRSGFGFHLVYISNAEPGRRATLDEVRQAVGNDLSNDQSKKTKDAMYQVLRDRYTVIYETDVLAPVASGTAATVEPANP